MYVCERCLDWLSKGGRNHNCEQHHSMGWGGRLDKKEDVNVMPAFTTVCFLTSDKT